MPRPQLVLAVLALLAAPAQAQESFRTEKAGVRVETVAKGLENPWSVAFLPGGGYLVTERPGRLRLVDERGMVSGPIQGVPRVAARGQGGLLDVALDPGFARNRLVYLSFSEPRPGGGAGTSVARGRLDPEGRALTNVEVVFRQEPASSGGNHFGSRLVFDRSGALFVTVGDRYSLRDQAQNPENHIGKVLRIRPEGGPAPGNPFLNREGVRPEVWSLGHRNVQGAALNPATGELWTAEHGARGGDEVNAPKAGRNYGWPVITYGRDYSGAKIGVGSAREGLEQPLHYWDPSIAPSGMAFYTGDKFPAWRGSVLVGALAGSLVSRLELDGSKVVREERMLEQLGERIRDVRQGPDGHVYLLTDSDQGRLLRLVPADGRG